MVPSATDLSVVSSGELSILTRKEYKNYNYINHKIDVSFYRAVNNSNYGWRALRLLARRSPHFFQPTNQQFKSLQTFKGQLVGVQDWPDAVCAGQKPSASPLRSYSEAHCSEFLSSLAVLPATVSFRMFDKPNRFHHAF